MKFSKDFYNDEAFPTRNLMKALRNCDNVLRNTSLTEIKLTHTE